jgi:hypothetical protein
MPHPTSLPSFFYNRCIGKLSGMKTPQQLSHQAIEEFKAIYQEEFDQSLSDDEVREIAVRLLRFFGILVQPLSDKTKDQTALE